MKNFSFANFASVTIVGSGVTGFLFVVLLDASIKGFLLIAIAAIVCALLSRASAATRHLVWTSTLVGVIAMPAFALLMPELKILPSWLSLENRLPNSSVTKVTNEQRVYSQPESNTGPSYVVSDGDEFDLPVIDAADKAETASVSTVIPSTAAPTAISLNANVMLAVWAAGFLVCLTPIVFSAFRLKQIERYFCRTSGTIDPRISKTVSQIAIEVGTKSPGILVGAAGLMPMVWSLGTPRLLLPADAQQWTDVRLRSVLLHELVHLRRRDPLIYLLGLFALAANWFNPLAWYAVRRLRAECERACDDHVLRTGIAPDEYATQLLELATKQQAAFGTGTVALAMATKPKIQSRIISILDQNLNRCGVNLRLTVAMLVAAMIGAATLATLAAHPGKTTISEFATPSVANDETKWPHCVVEIENLKPRALQEAVAQFNKQSKLSPIGSKQKPITSEEVQTAITSSLKLKHPSEKTKSVLRGIAKSGRLPANVYFRRFTRFDDEREFHRVWWVRLVVEIPDQLIYSVPVRTTKINSRPYTQMERQQNAQKGTSLINRFSTYFEGDPKFGAAKVIDQHAAKRVNDIVEKALNAKSMDDLRELCTFQGASKSTKQFMESELKTLIDSTVHSIQVTPRQFEGKLINWSAYQHYKPNLPVVAYLDVEFTTKAGDASKRRKVSFELGQDAEELRLVSYVPDGDMKLPKGRVSHSISGHNEALADGTFASTTIIINPGTLISAHLANEEMWQRDWNNVRSAKVEKLNKKPLENLEDDAQAATVKNQEPAFAVIISAVDAETKKPITEFSVVPTPYREGVRHVTWQRQYLRNLSPESNLYTLKTGWKETLLRVEAPGYHPEISKPLPRQRDQAISVSLKKDSGIKGIVLKPGGEPAVNSVVALCTWTQGVTVANGKIGHSRQQKLLRTGDDGTFHLPSEPDEWVLVISHESGYAERTAAELATSSRVTLQKWGRLSGRAVINGKPVGELKIDVGSGRGDVQVMLSYSGQVTTDTEGRFVLDKLPPVRLHVSPMFKLGETEHKPLWDSGLTKIKSGEVTEVTIPSPGQRIKGSVALPAELGLTLADVNLDVRCFLRNPPISGPRDYVNSAYQAYGEFMASEYGKAFQQTEIPVNADGTFEIKGLPATRYVVQISARKKDADAKSRPIAFIARRLQLESVTPDARVLDLGELVMRKQ